MRSISFLAIGISLCAIAIKATAVTETIAQQVAARPSDGIAPKIIGLPCTVTTGDRYYIAVDERGDSTLDGYIAIRCSGEAVYYRGDCLFGAIGSIPMDEAWELRTPVAIPGARGAWSIRIIAASGRELGCIVYVGRGAPSVTRANR